MGHAVVWSEPLKTEIKLLTPSDWQTYRDVRLRSLVVDSECLGRRYEQESGGTEAQWRGFLEEHTTFVAILDGATIGIIAITRSTYSGAAAITNVWRDPQFRGQRVGDKLMQAALRWARSQDDIHQVLLKVTDGCKGAERLYGRHGFKYLPTSALKDPYEHEMSLNI